MGFGLAWKAGHLDPAAFEGGGARIDAGPERGGTYRLQRSKLSLLVTAHRSHAELIQRGGNDGRGWFCGQPLHQERRPRQCHDCRQPQTYDPDVHQRTPFAFVVVAVFALLVLGSFRRWDYLLLQFARVRSQLHSGISPPAGNGGKQSRGFRGVFRYGERTASRLYTL